MMCLQILIEKCLVDKFDKYMLSINEKGIKDGGRQEWPTFLLCSVVIHAPGLCPSKFITYSLVFMGSIIYPNHVTIIGLEIFIVNGVFSFFPADESMHCCFFFFADDSTHQGSDFILAADMPSNQQELLIFFF